MNAYLASHTGMGDNLFMIGSINFLLQYYDKIFFLVKKNYLENVKLFFNNPNIICIGVEKRINIIDVLKKNYKNNDILVCGQLKRHIKSKITNKAFLGYKLENEKYNIDLDTITSKNYNFIKGFYNDIRLNLNIFYEYFSLPETQESQDLYNLIKDYRIIFIQLTSSNNKSLNISKLKEKYLNDENTILVCNDKNLYNQDNDKYELAQKFVYNKIINYITTIQNANEIYIVDSCFSGIVLPYAKMGKLKADTIRIIRRDIVKNYIL